MLIVLISQLSTMLTSANHDTQLTQLMFASTCSINAKQLTDSRYADNANYANDVKLLTANSVTLLTLLKFVSNYAHNAKYANKVTQLTWLTFYQLCYVKLLTVLSS